MESLIKSEPAESIKQRNIKHTLLFAVAVLELLPFLSKCTLVHLETVNVSLGGGLTVYLKLMGWAH